MAKKADSFVDTIAKIQEQLVESCNTAWRNEVQEQCARAGLVKDGVWTVEELADEVLRLQAVITAAQDACERLADIDPIHTEDCGCRDWSVRRCTCTAGERFAKILKALNVDQWET